MKYGLTREGKNPYIESNGRGRGTFFCLRYLRDRLEKNLLFFLRRYFMKYVLQFQLVLKDLYIHVPSTSQRRQERRSGKFICGATTVFNR